MARGAAFGAIRPARGAGHRRRIGGHVADAGPRTGAGARP